MNHQIVCEPVDVGPEMLLRAQRDAFGPGSEQLGAFYHFHDACELVWYSNASGVMQTGAGAFPIADGTAFYMPAMHSHQVSIGPGEKEWIYIHLDVSLVMSFMKEEGLDALERVICASFDSEQRARMNMIFEWILELSREGGSAKASLSRLVKLALIEITRTANVTPTKGADDLSHFARLRPALDLVVADPTANIDLETAAVVCNLSTAYFSRRFKAVLGMNFSEYVRSYRLRLAAQKLLSSGDRIADVAFRHGFSNPAHFTASFRKKFGVSPREYRAASKYGLDVAMH